MRSAVVIGANGFIGSQVVCNLLSHGYRITALDSSDSRLPANSDLSFVKVLPNDENALDGLSIAATDVVFHMAWNGVGAVARADYLLQCANILFDVSVLNFCKKLKPGRVIFPGSASEYAAGGHVVTGKGVFAPVDAYGAAKAASHVISDTYAQGNDIPLIRAITASVYGPGRDDNNILSYAIKKLLSGACPAFTKLEQRWDFIYIDDLIHALYLLGEQGHPGKTYPVASGHPRLLSEFVTVLRDSIDPELPIDVGALSYKSRTPDNAVFDISELTKDTGFEAATPFEEGIRRMIAYFNETGN
jgi:nucleoside-diphosphate-sugar epimerase